MAGARIERLTLLRDEDRRPDPTSLDERVELPQSNAGLVCHSSPDIHRCDARQESCGTDDIGGLTLTSFFEAVVQSPPHFKASRNIRVFRAQHFGVPRGVETTW